MVRRPTTKMLRITRLAPIGSFAGPCRERAVRAHAAALEYAYSVGAGRSPRAPIALAQSHKRAGRETVAALNQTRRDRGSGGSTTQFENRARSVRGARQCGGSHVRRRAAPSTRATARSHGRFRPGKGRPPTRELPERVSSAVGRAVWPLTQASARLPRGRAQGHSAPVSQGGWSDRYG